MIEILGKAYITGKEASKRYGYSERWFINKRISGGGPPFCQLEQNGRVIYPVEETDRWFMERLKEKE